MRREFSSLLLILLLSGVLTWSFSLRSVESEPATIVVPDDYERIQWAVGNASDGQSIFVRAGIYYGEVRINKSLSLIGEDVETTIIDAVEGGIPVIIYSDNVNLTGFTLQNCGFPPLQACVSIESDHNNVSYNKMTNTEEWYYMGFAGIYIEGQNNTIVGNDISKTRIGILMGATHNTIENNTISDNDWGIYTSCYNCTFKNNTISNNLYNGFRMQNSITNRLRDNKFINNEYNFGITGEEIIHFSHDIDGSNLVDGERIYYLIDQHDITIDPNSYPDAGFIGLINSTGITVRDLNLKRNIQGLLMANTNGSIIENVTTSSNEYGVYLYHSWENNIYHNNFIFNEEHAYISESLNTFDDGYPSGGNYWTGYMGNDVFSGVNQDELGSDGIGDSPYVIYGVHQDNYPLMSPYGTLPWDVTGDGYVGIDDIVEVANHFGQDPGHPEWNPKCDVTGDNYVGIDDVVLVAGHFGESV